VTVFNWLRSLRRVLASARREKAPVDAAPSAESPPALVGAAPATEPPRRRARPGPREGEQWVYVEASDVDVASVIRGIDGVQRVTRERSGIWKIVANRDINLEAARGILARGGGLTLLISTPYFSKLGLVVDEE
jgi:hypothetical protein